MEKIGPMIRRGLDALYLSAGILGAISLVGLLLVIQIQMIMRWSGGLFPGATSYAGYLMAAASFFALAYALNAGSHIRVTLFLKALGRYRRIGELWCLIFATAMSGYFCWFSWRAVMFSYRFNELSQGQDATPIWIPQLSMGLGTTILFIAFADNLWAALNGRPGPMDRGRIDDPTREE